MATSPVRFSLVPWVSLVLLLSLAGTPAAAQAGRLTPVGPGGGTVVSLAVDPTAPDTLYALTASRVPYNNGEIFRSSDGGASWARSAQGLPFLLQYSCQSLVLDPLHPGTLYTSIGPFVYRSTDGATSWVAAAPIGPPTEEKHCSLAVSPGHPGALFFAYGRQLLRSLDGGATWNPALITWTDIRALLVNPTAPHAVYLATEQGGGVWVSTDFGQTFSPTPWLDSADLLAAPAAGPPGLLYAVSSGTLYASIDGGVLWRRRGALGGPVYALAVDTVSPRTLYAGREHGAAVSRDGGETWQEANEGLPPVFGYVFPYSPLLAQVRALAGALGRPGTLYAGTSFAGVYRSEDSGGRWAAEDQRGLITGILSGPWFDPADPDIFYLKDGAGALWRTEDGGQSWQRRSDASRGFNFLSLSLDPTAQDTLFTAGPAGVHRSDDGGATWKYVGFALYGAEVVAITGRGELAVLDERSGVSRSTDGGATWSVVLPATFLYADPVRSSTLYGVVYTASWPQYDLYRSQDGGATWSRLLAGAYTIAISPSRPDTLYAMSYNDTPRRLFRSTDDGASWQDAGPMLQEPWDLHVDPHDPETLYTGANASTLWRSTDAGTTWTRMEADLVGLFGRGGIGVAACHPTKPKLYLLPGGAQGGLFELQLE